MKTNQKTVIYRASVRVRIFNRLSSNSWYWTEETVCRDFTYDPRAYPRCLEAWADELLNDAYLGLNIDKIITSPEVEEIEVKPFHS